MSGDSFMPVNLTVCKENRGKPISRPFEAECE